MEIRQYITLIKRWLWLIILGTLIGGLGGYYFSVRQTPVYQADTRFMILRAAPTSIDYYYYYEDNRELISTYIQLLTTESLLDKASEKLGFEVKEGQASAVQIGETQFASLTVKDEDPGKAVQIANILVQTLIETNEEMQSIRYQTTEKNLQDRINEAEVQISIVQEQINDMSVSAVQTQINDVQLQIDDLQAQITALEKRNTELNSVLTLTDEQKDELSYNQDTLDQIKPILDLYQKIYTNLVVLGVPVDSGSDSNVKLDQLKTTLALYQEIYIASVSDMEALRLSRAQSTPTVVQVEPATVPSSPISPKPLRTALLSAAVGLLLMGGIAFLIEYLDDTIKTPDEVTSAFGLPVIGMIAEMQSSKKRSINGNSKTGIFVANQPRSPISEAFRSLRTNLEFASIDNPLKTLMVTSTYAEEGKTTIAVNLAIILAQSDKKVLLLDGDLRRPKVHQHMELTNRVGLSDLIRGKIEIEDVLQESKRINGISIVTSGSLPPNPAELLGSNRMEQVLKKLNAYFDIIIIDAPPMLVSDAMILSTKVDGVIFTIQPGKSRIGGVRSSINELKRLEAKLLGVVMNRIPKNREYYYGGYYYYSSDAKKSGQHYYTNV